MMQHKRPSSVAQTDAAGPRRLDWFRAYGYWLLLPALALLITIGWRLAPGLITVAQDPALLEEAIQRAGWLGPLALIGLNALQIVVAPIPGYPVPIAAGFLYGPYLGALWGTLGLLAGATVAFWLARWFGRPLAEKLAGKARLDKWETVTHSASLPVWFIMLLGPTGDIPYFLAGLSRVRFAKILVIAAILRTPSIIVAASAGAGVMLLTWWQLVAIAAGLAGILIGFLRYQQPFILWFEGRVHRQVDKEQDQKPP